MYSFICTLLQAILHIRSLDQTIEEAKYHPLFHVLLRGMEGGRIPTHLEQIYKDMRGSHWDKGIGLSQMRHTLFYSKSKGNS